MKFHRHVIAVAAIFALHTGVVSAQRPERVPAPARQKARPVPRRDALELQVLNRFITRASLEMSLDASQRERLADILHASALKRRALNQRTTELRRQFAEAIRNQDTPAQTFTQILNDNRALRREEQQIADDEQGALQRFLSPRQQAQFLMLWIKLQENARQIQAQVPGAPGR